MQSITFIIFTYNSSDLIIRNIKHIKKAIEYSPIEHEVLLVDNNSTDKTIELVKTFSSINHFPVKIIKNPRQGLSFSRIEQRNMLPLWMMIIL